MTQRVVSMHDTLRALEPTMSEPMLQAWMVEVQIAAELSTRLPADRFAVSPMMKRALDALAYVWPDAPQHERAYHSTLDAYRAANQGREPPRFFWPPPVNRKLRFLN